MSEGGWVRIPRDIMVRRDLNWTAKGVFAEIADRIGKNSEAWPGLTRIAKECGLSRFGAIKAIRELEAAGILRVERIRQGGKNLVNHYRVVNSVDQVVVNTVDQGSQQCRLPVVNKIDHGVVNTVDSNSPTSEPTQLNLLNEPSPRTRRKRAGIEPPKPRELNPIWDGVCKVFALNPQTPSEKTRVGRIVRDLKLKSATAEEIEVRYARYCQEWPAAVASPEALLKHWDYFAVEHQRTAADQNPARYRSGNDQYAELTRRSIAEAKAAEARRIAGESTRPAANPGRSLADT